MNEFLRKLLWLPPQASTISTEIDHLHYFVIITTMIVSTVIGVGAIYFYVRYRWRGRIGAKGEPIYTSWWLEVAIIGLPAFFFLLWFGMGFRTFVKAYTPPKDAMDVYVMGKQWMWKFAYPDGPNGVGVLRVPVNKPVRLLITSRDVIHSFFVPAFRVKMDALPGRYTQTWFQATEPGTYQVLCTEMCGTGHSIMRAEVVVLPQAEFDQWMAEQHANTRVAQHDGNKTRFENKPHRATMAEMGRQIAASAGCFKCHSVDGSPHIGPTWLDMYRRKEVMEDGSTLVADEAYITESMMYPKARQVKGFQLVMPAYMGRLEGPESAAIVEYIKTLRSDRPNGTPDSGPIFDEKAGTAAQAGSGLPEIRTGGVQ